MNIRPATLADVEVLQKLEAGAATAAHWSERAYREMFSGAEPKRLALVAEDENQIRGFLVARSVAEEWEIENIVVTVAAQRRGLGSALLAECLKHAHEEGARAVFLEVRESNQPAKMLYAKMGFEMSGRRARYYGNPTEDALVYRVEIV
jgi:ribosomal-protein-alanine acetyltransferase